MTLVDPVASRHETRSLAPRRAPDAEIRVGLIDATLNKASLWGAGMLDAAETRLAPLLSRGRFVREQMNPLDNPPPDRWAAATAIRMELAVFSAGDCVTCTTRAVRSAIWLEVTGVPSAVVCTAAMADVVESVCDAYGMPTLARFPVERSFFGLGRQEIAAAAEPALSELASAVLLDPSDDRLGSV